jgi:hypothetical protein
MPEFPERKFVKVIKGGVSHTVPVEDLAYYKRAGYLEDGEEPNEANMTPAEKRMAQIARGEEPTNQASSLSLENVDLPASAEEIAVTVNYGGANTKVPGPAASAEARADAKEAPKAGGDEYDSLTVADLKERARDAEISGYSTMTKAELQKALRKAGE